MLLIFTIMNLKVITMFFINIIEYIDHWVVLLIPICTKLLTISVMLYIRHIVIHSKKADSQH